MNEILAKGKGFGNKLNTGIVEKIGEAPLFYSRFFYIYMTNKSETK
jgi:hypothetical protein